MLRSPTEAALFDTGSGTKDRIARSEVGLTEITHLLYTHAHVDHWTDLLALLFYRGNVEASERRHGLVIAGPPGFSDYARAVADAVSPKLLSHNADLRWVDVAPERDVLDGGWFRATPFRVSHTTQVAQAWRVESAGEQSRWSVAYSGDSEPCDGLLQAARGVDVLVCECSLPASKATAGHMTPEAVRELADKAKPATVVLTHLYPEVVEGGAIEAAFAGYDGRMIVGWDGLRVELSRRG